ncbi:hypothetical protein [Pseudanabaena sp. PCC 6802]|uniref:hypothetical protein n=1 Tax=Pseudanabaena sp. PCC 6802 TaxID=118173 RepID=UPI000346A73C|nr:hypothetical protein [Pseudanabaena sp. PCC 6802]
MTPTSIKDKVAAIASKRSSLVQLSLRSDLGNLRIDVTQALEEIDDLLQEFKNTFPDCPIDDLV